MVTGRRAIVKGAVGLGLGLAIGSPTRAQSDSGAARPKAGDLLVRDGDASATPLTADDIAAGAPPIQAWPMDPAGNTVRSASRLNRVLLVRLDIDALGPETKPLAAGGIVGYTAICTHAGCEVDDWLANERLLYCSCHSSQFDPRNGARVVDGPAPRSLPALPLQVVDGRLVVAGSFTTPVGFESA